MDEQVSRTGLSDALERILREVEGGAAGERAPTADDRPPPSPPPAEGGDTPLDDTLSSAAGAGGVPPEGATPLGALLGAVGDDRHLLFFCCLLLLGSCGLWRFRLGGYTFFLEIVFVGIYCHAVVNGHRQFESIFALNQNNVFSTESGDNATAGFVQKTHFISYLHICVGFLFVRRYN